MIVMEEIIESNKIAKRLVEKYSIKTVQNRSKYEIRAGKDD